MSGNLEGLLVLIVAHSSQELHIISELPTDFVIGVVAALTAEVDVDVLQIGCTPNCTQNWFKSHQNKSLIWIALKKKNNNHQKTQLFFLPLHTYEVTFKHLASWPQKDLEKHNFHSWFVYKHMLGG